MFNENRNDTKPPKPEEMLKNIGRLAQMIHKRPCIIADPCEEVLVGLPALTFDMLCLSLANENIENDESADGVANNMYSKYGIDRKYGLEYHG